VEGAAFLAFLTLGSRQDLLAGPYMGGCLGDNFLFAMDFLREDRIGSKGAFALAYYWGLRRALFARGMPRVFNRGTLW